MPCRRVAVRAEEGKKGGFFGEPPLRCNSAAACCSAAPAPPRLDAPRCWPAHLPGAGAAGLARLLVASPPPKVRPAPPAGFGAPKQGGTQRLATPAAPAKEAAPAKQGGNGLVGTIFKSRGGSGTQVARGRGGRGGKDGATGAHAAWPPLAAAAAAAADVPARLWSALVCL